MARYRKKTIVIDAIKWTGWNWDETYNWIMKFKLQDLSLIHNGYSIQIRTLKGFVVALPGDWIIKKDKDKFYILKQDIFAAIYDIVETQDEILFI